MRPSSTRESNAKKTSAKSNLSPFDKSKARSLTPPSYGISAADNPQPSQAKFGNSFGRSGTLKRKGETDVSLSSTPIELQKSNNLTPAELIDQGFPNKIKPVTYLGDNISEVELYLTKKVYEEHGLNDILDNKVMPKLEEVKGALRRNGIKTAQWVYNRINTEGAYVADYLFWSAFDDARNAHKAALKKAKISSIKNTLTSFISRKVQINNILKTGGRPISQREYKQATIILASLKSKGVNINHYAKLNTSRGRYLQNLIHKVKTKTTKISSKEMQLYQKRVKILDQIIDDIKNVKTVASGSSLPKYPKLTKIWGLFGEFLDMWGLAYNGKRIKGNKYSELAWPGVGSILPLLKDLSGFSNTQQEYITNLTLRINSHLRLKRIDSFEKDYDALVTVINNHNKSESKKKQGNMFGIIYTTKTYPVGKVQQELTYMKPGVFAYNFHELTQIRKAGLDLKQLHIGSLSDYTAAAYEGGVSFFNTFATVNLG